MPSKESLAVAFEYNGHDWHDVDHCCPICTRLADLLDEAIREARVSEHKLTCHKPLLQYDAKGKLIGNLRCGEDWACERLAQLEKR